MKTRPTKYILLKDLPSYKMGTVCVKDKLCQEGVDMPIMRMYNEENPNYQPVVVSAKEAEDLQRKGNFDEWFEELEQQPTLFEETEESIRIAGKTEDDVMFVGSQDGEYRISWKEFEEIADFEYDRGYGCQEIAEDLIVYFNDGSFLSRKEYDGSEWWEYNPMAIYKPDDPHKPFKRVTVDGNFETIKEINEQVEVDKS